MRGGGTVEIVCVWERGEVGCLLLWEGGRGGRNPSKGRKLCVLQKNVECIFRKKF